MKDRKKHSIPVKERPKPRGGRPSKADLHRILERNSRSMATLLKLLRLTGPHSLDPRFKPYYERFLGGNLRAIEDYCNAHLPLGASFYEVIGRLFSLRHYGDGAVKQILAGIDPFKKTSAVPIYDYWHDLLLPLCQSARRFIQKARASWPDAGRNKLWHEYLSQSSALDDELRTGKNQPDKEQRRAAIQKLCEWSENYTEASARSDLRDRGYQGKKLQSMARSEYHFENVERFSRHSLVSREIFCDLAQRRPVLLTPAAVARRYASWIAGISESAVSRKTVRK